MRRAGPGGTAEIALSLHEDFSRHRVAVRTKSRGGQTDEDVALSNEFRSEFVTTLEHANGEAGHVEVIGRHHATVFGGLTPEERGSRPATTFSDARHQFLEASGIEFSDGDVVEEKKRLGTDAGEVVNQHRHEVNAHRVVATDQSSDFEFRADAVGRRYEDW